MNGDLRGKYIGDAVDPPTDEAEHFIKCEACGGWIDCRDIAMVFDHEGTPRWAVTFGNPATRYQRFRFMTELWSLLSTLSIDPLASLGFCPMRGSDGFRLVFERSLLLLLKLSVAPRSKAPLVVTSDGPPIELPTPELPIGSPQAPICANASVELRDVAVTNANVLSFM